jgi:hypothetical protein
LYDIQYALISMLHTWNKNTDGNGSTNRVMTFDFRKAFDLIDHNILSEKLTKYNIPWSVILWILDFLTDREQRVKLSQDAIPNGERSQPATLKAQISARDYFVL